MSESRVTLTEKEREYLIDMLETQDEILREHVINAQLNKMGQVDIDDLNEQRTIISGLFSKI